MKLEINCSFVTLIKSPRSTQSWVHRLSHQKLTTHSKGLNGKAMPSHGSTSGHWRFWREWGEEIERPPPPSFSKYLLSTSICPAPREVLFSVFLKSVKESLETSLGLIASLDLYFTVRL